MPRVFTSDLAARAAPILMALVLVACDSAANPSEEAVGSLAPALTPGPVGSGLGALPGVEGFAYRDQPAIVPGFVAGAEESLAGAAEVEIMQAAVASRGGDEV